MGNPVVLAEAFTGAAALGRDGRRELVGVLLPGSAELEQAPLGDLFDDHHRRRLRLGLRRAVEADPVRKRWTDVTLASLFPGATLAGDGAVVAGSPRLSALLGRHRADRWAAVLALTVGEIEGWCDVGPKTVAEMLAMAFERSLIGVRDAGRAGAAGDAVKDLVKLLRHQGDAARALRAAIAAVANGNHPADVVQAAERLLRMADADPAPVPLRAVLDELSAAAGAARDLTVFVHRELAIRDRESAAQLGRRLRLSPERIRQLTVRAADRIRAASAEAAPGLDDGIAALRERLGAVAPVSEADRVTVDVGAGPTSTTAGLLALWLAGPYRPVPSAPGWLALDPQGIGRRTRRRLSEDGGVRLAAEMREELAALGVVGTHRDGWIAACGAVVVEDMVVSTAGSAGTVLERLLFATGRACTPAELAARAGGVLDETEARSVLARDRRFLATGSGSYELAEWHPASAPMLSPSARPAATAPPSTTPAIVERRWLTVRVDPALLSGAGTAIPAGLAEALGVGLHERRTFAGRFGPVVLANDPPQPSLVSLRPIALAAGASTGGTLVLGFAPGGEVTVRVSPADEPDPGDEAATALTQEGAA